MGEPEATTYPAAVLNVAPDVTDEKSCLFMGVDINSANANTNFEGESLSLK
jgi:hypothetical protein